MKNIKGPILGAFASSLSFPREKRRLDLDDLFCPFSQCSADAGRGSIGWVSK